MHAGISNHPDTDTAEELAEPPRRGRAALAVAGSAAVVVGGGAVGMSPVDAQEADTCLEFLADDPTEPEDWDGFFEACQPDFGGVKVVVDVVTDDGSPLPDDLDLDGIARSMAFSYGSSDLDAASALIPASEYQGIDYYEGLCVIGIAPVCDQLGGAHFGVLASVAQSYGFGGMDLDDNEFVVFHVGTQPPASLGTGGIADVGSGWELAAASFSPGFAAAWSSFPDDDGDSDRVRVTLELTQAPDPTTTTEAPPTTEAPTTTAAQVGGDDAAPAQTLPATGASDSTGMFAWMGAVLVAMGLGAVATVRRATRRA